MTLKQMLRISGAIVFAITAIIFYLSAERVGSLWDCGEFILGAYKLQVVHPPGAPLFLMIGRIFAMLGDVLSSNPEKIAFAVNLMSGLCTALAATFVTWITVRLASFLMEDPTKDASYNYPMGQSVALIGGGVVAGLATAFCSSIWFSAVEGEVYAMSTMFTAMTVWAVVKWYTLPEAKVNDKWLVFACYSAGLSIGVHLLSLLTFPALAIFVYLRKARKTSLVGILAATAVGAITVPLIQKFIIAGIPSMWAFFDVALVNSFGMPWHSGVIPMLAVVSAAVYGLFRFARRRRSRNLELIAMSVLMMIIGYSTFTMVPIRANADTPVNMNVPSDASRLLPYLNREQYGERPLAYGPHYEASPVSYDREQRKGRVSFPPHYDHTDNEYVVVDEKIKAVYASKDKMLFPRIAHAEMGRPGLYKQWYQHMFNGEPKPSFGFNIGFFLKYQIGWIYTRYFMWNFVGRQNGDQGFYAWDKSAGHWQSGVKVVDEGRLYNMDERPESMKAHQQKQHQQSVEFVGPSQGMKDKPN
ncbi:MAG: DUF2723 domain-containing protein [Bacteroidota bacterium]